MDLGIAGRVALVCGSSGGLGRAIGQALAAEGCRVVLNGRNAAQLDRAVEPLQRDTSAEVAGLTSIAAKQPLSGLILSSTARAAVLGFAKSLADEVAPDGVTVNVVCPGYMRTERVSDLVAERATIEDRDEAAIVKEMVGDIPMGRMGEPDELAAAFAFLASESARYITGAVLQVDGGYIRSIL